MKHALKHNFWARQTGYALYGILAITVFFLHNIEKSYSSLDTNVSVAMEERLMADDTQVAIVIPSKKPEQADYINLAQM